MLNHKLCLTNSMQLTAYKFCTIHTWGFQDGADSVWVWHNDHGKEWTKPNRTDTWKLGCHFSLELQSSVIWTWELRWWTVLKPQITKIHSRMPGMWKYTQPYTHGVQTACQMNKAKNAHTRPANNNFANCWMIFSLHLSRVLEVINELLKVSVTCKICLVISSHCENLHGYQLGKKRVWENRLESQIFFVRVAHTELWEYR